MLLSDLEEIEAFALKFADEPEEQRKRLIRSRTGFDGLGNRRPHPLGRDATPLGARHRQRARPDRSGEPAERHRGNVLNAEDFHLLDRLILRCLTTSKQGGSAPLATSHADVPTTSKRCHRRTHQLGAVAMYSAAVAPIRQCGSHRSGDRPVVPSRVAPAPPAQPDFCSAVIRDSITAPPQRHHRGTEPRRALPKASSPPLIPSPPAPLNLDRHHQAPGLRGALQAPWAEPLPGHYSLPRPAHHSPPAEPDQGEGRALFGKLHWCRKSYTHPPILSLSVIVSRGRRLSMGYDDPAPA